MHYRHLLLFSSYLFRLLCIIGLCYVVIMVSYLYFQYRVTTQITIEIDDSVEPLSTIICTRYTDILDYETLLKGQRIEEKDVAELKDNLTAAQIFELTPGIEEIVERIRWRQQNTYRIFKGGKLNGNKVIEIKKFLYSEFICYQIALKKRFRRKMRHHVLSVTTNSPGLVYELFFTNKLWLAHYMKIGLHTADHLPRRVMMYLPVFRRGFRNTSRIHTPETFIPNYNYLFNSAAQIDAKYLPAPYETDCWNYEKISPFISRSECTQTCNERETLAQLNRVTFTAVITKPHDKKLIANSREMLQQVEQTFDQIKNLCYRKNCRKRDCEYKLTITNTLAIRDDMFRVRMVVPQEPSIRKKTNPKNDFIEYFTFVSSTISTWLGISFLWFDPNNLIRLYKRKFRYRWRKKHSHDSWKKARSTPISLVAKQDHDINLLMAASAIMTRRLAKLEAQNESDISLFRHALRRK